MCVKLIKIKHVKFEHFFPFQRFRLTTAEL